MIFCGDISLPFKNAVRFENFPESLTQKPWIGNLEGSLVNPDKREKGNLLDRQIVFNDSEAIQELTDLLNIRLFNIANNHILDAANIEETLQNLAKTGIPHVGAGRNLHAAQSEITIPGDKEDFIITSFGWNAINCIYAKTDKEGVNPYTKSNVFNSVQSLINRYPTKKIICLFHWNYELEEYPQPFDRETAHALIDSGVYAIIGCHAHRIQPIEIYKGRPIVYGLGNFAFRQSTYMRGNLKFPPFTQDEIAFEISESGEFTIHKFKYNPEKQSISYSGSQPILECPFQGMNNQEYKSFFKRHRYQKKALPIFYYEDRNFIHNLKISSIIQRNKLTLFLSKNKKLFNLVKASISFLYGKRHH